MVVTEETVQFVFNCTSETNECWSMPCKNGALCSDVINGYTCTCAADYTGTDCTKRKTSVMLPSTFYDWP